MHKVILFSKQDFEVGTIFISNLEMSELKKV